MIKSFFSLQTITVLLTLTSLHAQAGRPLRPYTEETLKHLTLASVEAFDITSQYDEFNEAYEFNIFGDNTDLTPIGRALDQADLIVDKVINIGEKIWTVVEKGRPIANYSKSKATALPSNTTRWDQLENWRTPKSKVISIVYKNVLGMEVVRFKYRIILLYGGTVKGTGKYIGYASVEPLEITTAYMYTFNARAKVEAVFNMGTSQNPIAGMILNVDWTVETALKKTTVTHTYHLDGLGNIAAPTDKLIAF